jgi:CHAD domain-containing protein
LKRYLLPPDADEGALERAVRNGRRAVLGPTTDLTVTYLDTFDWRLHSSGLVLVEERGPDRRLVLLQQGREPYVVTTRHTPRTSADLPAGHLSDLVGPTLGVRALVAIGRTRVERRDGRIEDSDGNLASLLRIETAEPLDPDDRPSGRAIRTVGVGEPGLVEGIFEPAPDHDLVAAAAAWGRAPGDYSSKLRIALAPDRSATASIRAILLYLLDTLEVNVDGTVADIDTEFLHDFRVACRRTRSALTQLKGVLPAAVSAPFNAEFKWLGGVTGPLRDLHVYQLEMPVYRSMLPGAAGDDLAPLEALIDRERRRAHRSVARALRSRRFADLRRGWRRALEELDPDADGDAAVTTAALAAARISRAYRRVLKKGRDLDVDPPAEALHRLRIEAKKLRYLLEFFKSLYPEPEMEARIKELKRFQDILGGFNDMEVQRERLIGFAQTLHADPSVPAASLMTLGRLAGMLEDRQERFRLAFHDAFVPFSGAEVRTAYHRLFGGKEPT